MSKKLLRTLDIFESHFIALYIISSGIVNICCCTASMQDLNALIQIIRHHSADHANALQAAVQTDTVMHAVFNSQQALGFGCLAIAAVATEYVYVAQAFGCVHRLLSIGCLVL